MNSRETVNTRPQLSYRGIANALKVHAERGQVGTYRLAVGSPTEAMLKAESADGAVSKADAMVYLCTG